MGWVHRLALLRADGQLCTLLARRVRDAVDRHILNAERIGRRKTELCEGCWQKRLQEFFGTHIIPLESSMAVKESRSVIYNDDPSCCFDKIKY